MSFCGSEGFLFSFFAQAFHLPLLLFEEFGRIDVLIHVGAFALQLAGRRGFLLYFLVSGFWRATLWRHERKMRVDQIFDR